MPAPGDAPKAALKIPLAQGAVIHVAELGVEAGFMLWIWSPKHAGMTQRDAARDRMTNRESYDDVPRQRGLLLIGLDKDMTW